MRFKTNDCKYGYDRQEKRENEFRGSRAVGRSENPRVPVLFDEHNLPRWLRPLVEIGLKDLPKSGGAMAPPAPPGTTTLGSHLNPNPRKNKVNDKKSKRNLKRQISRLLKEKAFNDKDIVTLSMSNRVHTVLDILFQNYTAFFKIFL